MIMSIGALLFLDYIYHPFTYKHRCFRVPFHPLQRYCFRGDIILRRDIVPRSDAILRSDAVLRSGTILRGDTIARRYCSL
jgi:hypothetical protein